MQPPVLSSGHADGEPIITHVARRGGRFLPVRADPQSTRERAPATVRAVSTGPSLRAQFYATRPISRDNLVPEDPALGLIAFASPNDPEPSLRIEDGRVVELDGKSEAEFDLLDEFIARRGIDLAVAEEAMALDDVAFARHARRRRHAARPRSRASRPA